MKCEWFANPQLLNKSEIRIGFHKITDCQIDSGLSSETLHKLRRRCRGSHHLFIVGRISRDDILEKSPVTIHYENNTYGPTYGNIYCFYCNWHWSAPFPNLKVWTMDLAENERQKIEIITVQPPENFFILPENDFRYQMPEVYRN